jgi:hypothetical protein
VTRRIALPLLFLLAFAAAAHRFAPPRPPTALAFRPADFAKAVAVDQKVLRAVAEAARRNAEEAARRKAEAEARRRAASATPEPRRP